MNKKIIFYGSLCAMLFAGCSSDVKANVNKKPKSLSGVYPSLATFNNEDECGTGAVVPWAGSLWLISYAPHAPEGSSDKLYQITEDLQQIVRGESVGGTPANRMIHRESNQLLIGPYVIDDEAQVRVITPKQMPGRLTGNARHLTDPKGKVYYATMEEALYEVDMKTLAVNTLVRDGNINKKTNVPGWDKAQQSKLPGYHGKGLCSGFGKVFYANNGENSPSARKNPFIPSGALAEWGVGDKDWNMIYRTQFTEITTKDGVYGNEHPNANPIWAMGWDARSVILAVNVDNKWSRYRLPKASHCYDGAHGWNTEWPRIREIGEGDEFLATMHGTFWEFPADFAPGNAKGIRPRSTYLKVVGDFCKWQDKIVFGCDDSARSEFLNRRKAKGKLLPPGRSQSNLWFVDEDDIDDFGPVVGHGSVWLNDAVKTGDTSEAYLFAGYDFTWLWILAETKDSEAKFTVEFDKNGNGNWSVWKTLSVPKGGAGFDLSGAPEAEWIRLVAVTECSKVSAVFHQREEDERDYEADDIFDGIAKADPIATGLMHITRGAADVLSIALDGNTCYELDKKFDLIKSTREGAAAKVQKDAPIPQNVIQEDAASLIYVDNSGKRWRIPRGKKGAKATFGRVSREVCTERDLFNAGGIFYELPALNAGGFERIRPVATHNAAIYDYASWRGLAVLCGVDATTKDNKHIIRSADGKCAVWAGVADDLWHLGKARGVGGPWAETFVNANVKSDPYLMNNFDKKSFTLKTSIDAEVTLEADIDGSGIWVNIGSFNTKAGEVLKHEFPRAFSAYWVRASVDRACTASLQFEYR